MRNGLIVLWMLLCSVASAAAQVSVGIGLPGVSIGINLLVYPELIPVPGYPVYYAPQLNSNYFFYDGVYWVYEGDNWYTSSWYNGPWALVVPEGAMRKATSAAGGEISELTRAGSQECVRTCGRLSNPPR